MTRHLAAGLAFAAVAAATAALFAFGGRGGGDRPARRPHGTGLIAASQIATHVQERYRLAGGDRVAEIQVSSTYPIARIVVPAGGRLRSVAMTGQLQYTICGPGTPSVGCAL